MPSRGLHSRQLLRPAFSLRPSSGHERPFLLDRLMVSRTWLTSTICPERGRQTRRQTDRQAGRQADRQTERQKTDRKADRDRQAGRQTDRQTDRHTERQTEALQ